LGITKTNIPQSGLNLMAMILAFPVIVLQPGYFAVFDFAARLRNKKSAYVTRSQLAE